MSQAIVRFYDKVKSVDLPVMSLYEKKISKQTGNRLQIVLKVSERCNIACTYCYFFFMGDESYKDNPAIISSETTDGLAAFIKDAVVEYGIEVVTITLHGGEPLMLKHRDMENLIINLIENSGGVPINFCVQTNAMLINDDWINLFEKYQVFVGVSLDGPEKFNDINRVDKKQNGTYKATYSGIQKLFNAAQLRRIQEPGLLWVVNLDFPPSELFHHFVHELGFTNIDFLLPDGSWDNFDFSQSERYRDYVNELFDLYQKNKKPGLRIRFFDQIIGRIGKSAEHRRLHSHNEASRNLVITVSSKGDIAPDDILRSSNPSMMRLGLNAKSNKFRDYLTHPTSSMLSESSLNIPTACNGCVWRNICQGGELYHRYKSGVGFDNPSIYCLTLKSTYENVVATFVANGVPIQNLIDTLEAQI